MSERKDICKNCRFWEAWNYNEVRDGSGLHNMRGSCKRYPPSSTVSNSTVPRWPQVLGNDWCGEFQSKVLEKAILEVLAEAELNGDQAAAKALRDLIKEKVGL